MPAAPSRSPDIFGPRWSELEAEIDAALAAGEDERGRVAIREWIEHVERELGGPG
jgi:hypothetical protein